jgi:hypothetical protein
MRTLSSLAALTALAAVLLAGGDKSNGHPHFNDGGTLHWYTKLSDAQAAAKKEGKVVFVEYGREA